MCRFLYLLLGVCCHVYHVTAGKDSCQDIDAKSCIAMASQNPDMCTNPTMSTSVCPKLCNNCPLTCFSCDSNDTDISNCNTITCSSGEKCMLWSNFEAEKQQGLFKMRCGPKSICSMMIRREMESDDRKLSMNQQDIDRRDVLSIHCCDGDLCNTPTLQLARPYLQSATTTPPVTATTQPKTTTTTPLPVTATSPPTIAPTTTASTTPAATTTAATAITTTATAATTTTATTATTTATTATTTSVEATTKRICKKDLIFMLGNTCTTQAFAHVKSFVAKVINSMDINSRMTRVGLGTFKQYHSGTRNVNLSSGCNKYTLLSTLSTLSSTRAFGTSNIAAVRYLLDNYFTVGNRPDVDDVIVIVSDGHLPDFAPFFNRLLNALHTKSSNVIVIAYGEANTNQLRDIATDRGHFIYNNWDRSDTALRTWLTEMICS